MTMVVWLHHPNSCLNSSKQLAEDQFYVVSNPQIKCFKNCAQCHSRILFERKHNKQTNHDILFSSSCLSLNKIISFFAKVDIHLHETNIKKYKSEKPPFIAKFFAVGFPVSPRSKFASLFLFYILFLGTSRMRCL